ncbi:hypothetical protein K493DRAFT_299439 [Basidiobolus meristosporus CBS 931.73]|uniref:Uncharacterized protein n=1 Tax=Basidiobolus meristosporus CBS 931.73 TaxID=1314790 RepID=A0A1Y1YMT8_9FUNG|nr:hypothetical protein K493DRAFT_299439 [Basidiobolus meristosporus CBS 931.73]|eukprot:ORX99332.1 hypothetical protein K493DRAFT_299439 [Basidiobolus meristosporus CBS 931.73]
MEPPKYFTTFGSLGCCPSSNQFFHQSHKRHGRIFLTDAYSTNADLALKVPTPINNKRYGQVFINPLPSPEGPNSRLKTEYHSHKNSKCAKQPCSPNTTHGTFEKTPQGNQRLLLLAPVDKNASPKDDLDQVRRRLRSVKSFDDMLYRGFLVDEKLNQYEPTIRFSLTPKIARDSRH